MHTRRWETRHLREELLLPRLLHGFELRGRQSLLLAELPLRTIRQRYGIVALNETTNIAFIVVTLSAQAVEDVEQAMCHEIGPKNQIHVGAYTAYNDLGGTVREFEETAPSRRREHSRDSSCCGWGFGLLYSILNGDSMYCGIHLTSLHRRAARAVSEVIIVTRWDTVDGNA